MNLKKATYTELAIEVRRLSLERELIVEQARALAVTQAKNHKQSQEVSREILKRHAVMVKAKKSVGTQKGKA